MQFRINYLAGSQYRYKLVSLVLGLLRRLELVLCNKGVLLGR
jgi:hypothetical protein